MSEKPFQHELFPEHHAEEVDAPETESVEGYSRYSRDRVKKAPPGQSEMFPEDRRDAERLARFRPGPAREALREWLKVEKRILAEQEEAKKKKRSVL